MANTRISALPLKAVPANNDLIPLVDLQFGSGSYVNKKTRVSDLMALANNYINTKIGQLSLVTSVSGRGGNVVLSLSDISNVSVTAPANLDLIVYSATSAQWVNRSFLNLDFVIDCGEF
jgi:hypothetical protein